MKILEGWDSPLDYPKGNQVGLKEDAEPELNGAAGGSLVAVDRSDAKLSKESVASVFEREEPPEAAKARRAECPSHWIIFWIIFWNPINFIG